jgi:uncharacterized protein YjiS (DUF1127 family)
MRELMIRRMYDQVSYKYTIDVLQRLSNEDLLDLYLQVMS